MGKNSILGIAGMPGSGKTILTNMFIEKGWNSIYFGSVTFQEIDKRNMEHTAQNEKYIREQLRDIHGKEAYAKILMPEIIETSKKGPLVLDGLYSWSEYKYLKSFYCGQLKVLAIVANSELRYNRLRIRPIRPLNKKEAVLRDYAEIENIEKGGLIAIADYYISNNGNISDMGRQFEIIINQLF